ncbi:MAG TPA: DUF4382 domain-containing protein [Hanamia sp.]|nr:DUF4382 domain-containing protein [Hanamia sp.]
MKTKKMILPVLLLGVLLFAVFFSCKKVNDSTTTNVVPAGKHLVSVYLNDDPIPKMLKVLVNIRYIEVKVDTGKVVHSDDYYNNDQDSQDNNNSGDHYGKWDTLSITPQVYDLLKLTNGMDTLAANSFARVGKITKIRITLGPNDTLWTDSTHSYQLTLCDHEPYIYARVTNNTIDTLTNGQAILHIDFNVAKSINYDDGLYCFEPKISCYNDNNTGQLAGIVKPGAAYPSIMIYNGTDTAYAMPEEDGEFKILGIIPAIYNVLYKATAPYKDTLINNVQIIAGQTTPMPPITLYP